MKQKFLFLIPIFIFIGLATAGSARATIVCPTASPQGVGCASEPSQTYYCSGQCRDTMVTGGFCPSNSYDVSLPTPNCKTYANGGVDTCGVCQSCETNYVLCAGVAYPTRTCVSNDPAYHCATLTGSNCNNTPTPQCATCVSGYTRCATDNTCIATQSCEPWETFNACTDACEGEIPTLQLNYDSVNSSDQIIQSANPTLYIPSNGFVGLGISAPESLLHVSPPPGLYSILAGAATTSPFRIGNVDDPGEDYDAATKFYVDSVAGTAQSSFWNLNGSNLYASSTSWNVGIGTTAPTNGNGTAPTLHVEGVDYPTIKVKTTSASKGAFFQIFNDNSFQLTFGMYGSSNASTLFGESAGNKAFIFSDKPLKIGTISNQYLSFGTNNSEIVRISGAGNVGIGTTAPGARLEVVPVSGYAILAGTATTSPFRIGNVEDPSDDYDAANKWYVDNLVSSATSSIATLWGGAVGGNIWSLNSGNVGIGTTNPASKLVLDLDGAGKTLSFSEWAGAGTYATYGWGISTSVDKLRLPTKVYFGDSSFYFEKFGTNNYNGRLRSYKDFEISSNGGSGVRILLYGQDSTGNVGIGTTNPLSKLHLYNGASGATPYTNSHFILENNGRTILSLLAPNANDNYIMFGSPAASNRAYIGYQNSAFAAGPDAFIFYTSGRFNFSGGSVGIGTTAPGALLHVATTNGIYGILAGAATTSPFRVGNVDDPSEDSDVATKVYVDSLLTSIKGVATYVGVSSSAMNGNNNGTIGYGEANSACDTDQVGAHVCMAFEFLYSIASGVTMPTENVWIFNGPPAYTASANDCEGRTTAAAAPTSYGTYWEAPSGSYPQGRGLLGSCSASVKLACCR